MSEIKKEKDYVELSFRSRIGGKHVFDTAEEALDWAEERGYEPEEIKVVEKEGDYLYKSTLWNTKEQAEVIRDIVNMYASAHPESHLYAGEAYNFIKLLMLIDNPDELKERVKEVFKEEEN
ncbi:hypothetical protein LCFBJUUZ_CDS0160 [Staphylococcus phage PG-2021_76]|uniref:Phage protein n=1 Tax=Mammaliicoccus phage MSShimriz1 TaxID=3230127 RepID=A0AAU8GVE3_9VIRU